MKWFSLAIAAVVLSVAANAQAGRFWPKAAPIASQVYHSNGAELAGDTPHRWYHHPVGYGLHVDHGYYSGNSWYHHHDFYNNAFYHGQHGRSGCRSWQGLWSGFCQEKCRSHKQRGCNRCGKSRQRGCGCGHGHRGHGCGQHRGCGCGHHDAYPEPSDEDAPGLPEAAPKDDAPKPPMPKPDVSAGLLKDWPRLLAFLS
ncbi:MAG: hypothetical protein IIA67_11515, partial [Planctomycetes bacterium]|nr:hypothetical protein [Planctomycetota bacterium]